MFFCFKCSLQTIQHKMAELKTSIAVCRSFIDECIAQHNIGCLDNSTASMAKVRSFYYEFFFKQYLFGIENMYYKNNMRFLIISTGLLIWKVKLLQSVCNFMVDGVTWWILALLAPLLTLESRVSTVARMRLWKSLLPEQLSSHQNNSSNIPGLKFLLKIIKIVCNTCWRLV